MLQALASRRRFALIGMLGISIYAAIKVDSTDGYGIAEPSYSKSNNNLSQNTSTKTLPGYNSRELNILDAPWQREIARESNIDLFSVQRRAPENLPRTEIVVEESPPPKQAAPPLPFRYLGVLEGEHKHWLIQLQRGGEYLIAEKGDVIGEVYRLDGFEDGNLMFTYLPLSIRQTLPIAPEM